MMAAILNYVMLDTDTLLSSLGFTQKHSHSTLNQTNSIWITWWWLPSWILLSSIQSFCTKLWLKLIQSDSNSFILTQLDDGSHLEFCHLEFGHLGFSHLSFSSQTHSHLLQDWFPNSFAQKKNLHSFILTQLDDGSHLEFHHVGLHKYLHSFILTQLDDGSHLVFYHVGFRDCHLGYRHLVIFSRIHSKTLSLHSDSWLKLIQSNSKLIHSHSTWR